MHLRHILPIIVFLTALFGQTRTQQEAPSQNKRDETHSPAPVMPAQPPAKQEQRNTTESAKKCPLPPWTDPFWPNWALVLVTGFAVWAAFGTLSDLKEQAVSAKNTAVEAQRAAVFSRDATKQSQRSDILIESISITAGNQNWTQNGDAKLVVRFKNFGRTRAADVRLKVELAVPGTTITRGIYEPPIMVLGKGQDQTVATETFYDCVGLPLFNEVIKGQKEMRFTASVVYGDVFGDSYTTMDAGIFDPRTTTFKILQKIAG